MKGSSAEQSVSIQPQEVILTHPKNEKKKHLSLHLVLNTALGTTTVRYRPTIFKTGTVGIVRNAYNEHKYRWMSVDVSL